MYGTFKNDIRMCLKALQRYFCDLTIKYAFVPETCYMGIIGVVMGQQKEKIRGDGEEEIFLLQRYLHYIKPVHEFAQVLLKCNTFIFAVIIRLLLFYCDFFSLSYCLDTVNI